MLLGIGAVSYTHLDVYKRQAGKIFFQGFFFLSGLAILLCLLMQASSPFILGRLISSPEIYRAVIQYLDSVSYTHLDVYKRQR